MRSPAQPDADRFVRVTHPFHPWSGRSFPFVAVRHTWGEDRVFVFDDGAAMKSLPRGWTDLADPDVFVALAEVAGAIKERATSAIGLYETELIRRHGPWRNRDQVEIATLEYIDWFNHRRLHGEIGYVPPADLEEVFFASRTEEQIQVSTEPGRFGLALKATIGRFLGWEAAGCTAVSFVKRPEGTVAMVRCRPRSRETWLRDGEREEFYVRVSNSNAPLAPSEATRYIRECWG